MLVAQMSHGVGGLIIVGRMTPHTSARPHHHHHYRHYSVVVQMVFRHRSSAHVMCCSMVAYDCADRVVPCVCV